MSYFSFNVLSTAQNVIGTENYLLRKYKGRKINEAGYYISEFEAPKLRKAVIIPVQNTQYKDHGLDLTKHYIQVFDTDLINVISRESNADEIVFKGYVYHAVPDISFTQTDDWNCVVAVRIRKE